MESTVYVNPVPSLGSQTKLPYNANRQNHKQDFFSSENSPTSISRGISLQMENNSDHRDQNDLPFRVIFPFLRSSSDQKINQNERDSVREIGSENDINTVEKEINDEEKKTKRKMSDEFRKTIQDLRKPIKPIEVTESTRNDETQKLNSAFIMPSSRRLSLKEMSKSNSHSNTISFPRYPTNDFKVPQCIQTGLQDEDNESCGSKLIGSDGRPRSILRRNNFSSDFSAESSSSWGSDCSLESEFLSNKFGNISFSDPIAPKASSTPLLNDEPQKMPPRRGSTGILGRKISFDPQVWVHEYKRKEEGSKDLIWWSQSEMDNFKDQAIARIRRRHSMFTGSGTGRIICTTQHRGRAFYNHPALGVDGDEEEILEVESLRQCVTEIKSILIIDPQEIFLRLFTKSMKVILPHAHITTARTSEEALQFIETSKLHHPLSEDGAVHGFDIIIAEERLYGLAHEQVKQLANSYQHASQVSNEVPSQIEKPILSGSDFFERLSLEEEDLKKSSTHTNLRFSLFIGVSAHSIEDRPCLIHSGASMVWGKPPPPMNNDLKVDLVKSIIKKRNKKDVTVER